MEPADIGKKKKKLAFTYTGPNSQRHLQQCTLRSRLLCPQALKSYVLFHSKEEKIRSST